MSSGIQVSKKTFLINSASSIGARLLNMGVLVWLQQHLLHRIAPAEYAIYPVVASILFITPIIASFLTGGIMRFLLDAYAREDNERVTRLVSSIFPLLLLGSLLVTAIGWMFSWHIERILTIDPAYVHDARIMASMLVLQFAFTLPASPFNVGFHLRQRYTLLNGLDLLQQMFRLALLFALLFGVSTRVMWVVVANFIASGVFSLIKTCISRRLVPALTFRPSLFEWGLSRELISFGLWQTINHVSNFLYNSQTILLNKLGTPVDVTSFYVGNMIDEHVRAMIDTASEPIQPTLAAFHAREDDTLIGEAYLSGGRYMMWASLFVATPLIVFGRELIQLYIGSVYQQAAWVLALLLLAHPFVFSNKLLFRIALAMGRIRWITAGSILKQFINIGISLFLVWHMKMGAIGSAIGVLSSQVLVQLFFFWPLGLKYARVSLQRFMNETVWPGMFPALGAMLLMVPLKYCVHPDSWVELGLCAAVGLIPYLAVLLLCLRPHEREGLAIVYTRLRARLQFRRAT